MLVAENPAGWSHAAGRRQRVLSQLSVSFVGGSLALPGLVAEQGHAVPGAVGVLAMKEQFPALRNGQPWRDKKGRTSRHCSLSSRPFPGSSRELGGAQRELRGAGRRFSQGGRMLTADGCASSSRATRRAAPAASGPPAGRGNGRRHVRALTGLGMLICRCEDDASLCSSSTYVLPLNKFTSLASGRTMEEVLADAQSIVAVAVKLRSQPDDQRRAAAGVQRS